MYKLNLTNVLQKLDFGDKELYSKLEDEHKKEFQPFVLMRYMSSSPGVMHNLSLVAVNEIVNIYFWDLSKDKDLQCRLLATCGLQKKTYHKWIPNKKSTSNNLESFIIQMFKDKKYNVNKDEINLYISMLDENELKNLILDYGIEKEQEKKILKEFKNLN